MTINTEIKKVDAQGRIVLPRDWRERELKENRDVIIIEEKGILKIIPQRKVDLTKFFDSLELEDDMIEYLEDWSKFELAFLNKTMDDNE